MRTFRARYVFPVSQPPIENGVVTIDQGRIVAIGGKPELGPIEDLGDVALLPGLVNAHTHLEFSDLTSPLGVQGNTLVEWIRTLVAHRRATGDKAGAIARGLAESASYGVTTLADIAQPGSLEQWATLSASNGISSVVFLELLAPTPQRVPSMMETAARFVDERSQQIALSGLSPHAPYSVHPELLSRAIDLAVREHLPVAMHLAESPEEMQLLADGTGPMREFLESIGAWDAASQPAGRRPLDYLQALALADRSLVIHGNYLDDEEVTFVAEHRDRMAVVFCPRTHAWFDHKRYPLEKLLAAGALVALGTDSRASNPDLSILAEMRYLFRTYPAVRPATILELGTLGGAQALGLAKDCGRIEVKKLAHLCVVPLPNESPSDPHELLLGANLAARPVL